MIKILLVDDSALIRSIIGEVIKHMDDLEIIDYANDENKQ